MKCYLLAICCTFSSTVFSQAILPASKSLHKDMDKASLEIINAAVDQNKRESIFRDSLTRDNVARLLLHNETLKQRYLLNSVQPGADNKSALDFRTPAQNRKALTKSALELIADTLNKTRKVTLIGLGGVSNLENSKKTYGNLTGGVMYRLSRYKVIKNNWIDPHYVYLLFGLKSASSSDSASLQKTFLFPELNKRDFVLGYFMNFQKNDWTIAPTFEFSINRLTDSANTKTFVSQGFSIGVKIQKELTDGNLRSFLAFYPYYSLITVDKKYFDDYKALTKEPDIPSTFHAIGLHVSGQLTNGILFCNMKYILNKEGAIKSADLKRFVYTVGTLLNL